MVFAGRRILQPKGQSKLQLNEEEEIRTVGGKSYKSALLVVSGATMLLAVPARVYGVLAYYY